MLKIDNFAKNAGPITKVVAALLFTTGVVVAHKWFYAPYVKRQRYKQAEEWANAIVDHEEQNENTSNNIAY